MITIKCIAKNVTRSHSKYLVLDVVEIVMTFIKETKMTNFS